jgi:acyl-CoA thioesterase
VSGGEAELTMPFLRDYAQAAGLMHGGALVSLADTAVGLAIRSVMAPGTYYATIALDAKYLLPVKKGIVTAKAKMTGREGRIITGEATLFDEEKRPVLEFRSTFKMAKDATVKNVIYEK